MSRSMIRFSALFRTIRETRMIERINRDPSEVEPKKEWIAYLESIGEHSDANAWRWIVDNAKYPVYRPEGTHHHGWNWDIFVGIPHVSGAFPLHCWLQQEICDRRVFKTPFDAFQALVARLITEKDKFGLSDKPVESEDIKTELKHKIQEYLSGKNDEILQRDVKFKRALEDGSRDWETADYVYRGLLAFVEYGDGSCSISHIPTGWKCHDFDSDKNAWMFVHLSIDLLDWDFSDVDSMPDRTKNNAGKLIRYAQGKELSQEDLQKIVDLIRETETVEKAEQVKTDAKPTSDDRSTQLMKQIESTETVLNNAEKRMREWMEAIEGKQQRTKQQRTEQQPKPDKKKSKPTPIERYRQIVERGADCEELGDFVLHYDLEFCKRELNRLERIDKWKKGILEFFDMMSRAKSKLASSLALVWGFVVFSAEIILKCLVLLVVITFLSAIFTFASIGVGDFLDQILR